MENPHKFMSPKWYEWTHKEAQSCHDVFMDWTRDKVFEKVMEVGCGKCAFYAGFFNETRYVGLDKDLDVVAYRNDRHIPHITYCGDVLTWRGDTADLVFSRAVIDHMEDPDAFVRACLELSTRYVYIMNYRGYFADIEQHRGEHRANGFWYTDISVRQIEHLLSLMPVKYDVNCICTGRKAPEIKQETHIIIEKL